MIIEGCELKNLTLVMSNYPVPSECELFYFEVNDIDGRYDETLLQFVV